MIYICIPTSECHSLIANLSASSCVDALLTLFACSAIVWLYIMLIGELLLSLCQDQYVGLIQFA